MLFINWLSANVGTLVVLAAVVALLASAAWYLVRSAKKGKSVLGTCAGCEGCNKKGGCGGSCGK